MLGLAGCLESRPSESLNFCCCRRYLTHVMHVATPTKDCLELVHELLAPVLQASADDAITRQEVSGEDFALPDGVCKTRQ